MQVKKVSEQYIQMVMGAVEIYTFPMQVKDLVKISYVAVRGRDDVPGAVQRVLNKRRITSIRDFVLEGNIFFNMFLLNWVDEKCPIEIKNQKFKDIVEILYFEPSSSPK